MSSSAGEARSVDLGTARGQREKGNRAVLGFRNGSHGAHSARTIMLAELEQILAVLPAEASRTDYERAIVENNGADAASGIRQSIFCPAARRRSLGKQTDDRRPRRWAKDALD
jgi:hypothetical protein